MTKVNVNKLLHSTYEVSVTKFGLQFTHSMALQVIQNLSQICVEWADDHFSLSLT